MGGLRRRLADRPGSILRLNLGDAVVLRNTGGRVTPAVIRDVAHVSYLLETKPSGYADLPSAHQAAASSSRRQVGITRRSA